ncbi:MAG TPA: CHAD domain-containing protein [Candidatus Limnocylindrales bacterium]|jgi:CHAD domain-containing protein|nr:CHAD domain-containing protein [Candidatus Limnocylindrales bacterium]
MTHEATRPARSGLPVEIELKYRPTSVAAAERYLSTVEIAGLVPASRTRTTQLEDRYVDTADGALARAGFAARLRVTPESTIVSIKSTARRATGSGPFQREELEGPADRRSAPRDWPASDARSLLLELCGDAPLIELVTIRQLRRKRELRDGGTVLELSLDEVDVVARSQVVDRFVELEVELVKGSEARLARVADVLGADPALVPSGVSKLEAALAAVRGHVRRHGPLPTLGAGSDGDAGPARTGTGRGDGDRPRNAAPRSRVRGGASPRAPSPAGTATLPADAAGGEAVASGDGRTGRPAEPDAGPAAPPPPLVAGKTPGVTADDHLAEAGRKVLRFHLARMLAHEAGTRSGDDPEDLHSMRVATRRMRAAWRVFGDTFRAGRTRRHRARLRELAGRLGAVRDMDVLIEGAESWAGDQPDRDREALEPLVATWRRYRDDARVLLVRELDSDAHARFVEAFRVFVQTEGEAVRPVGRTEPHHVRDTAPSRVLAAYERVRAYEPVLRWADVETLHDLRIAAKWLRYTLEFFREALGPDTGLLVPRVVALQDHLGYLHDADVASSMARSFLVERGADLDQAEAAAVERFLASRDREVSRLRGSVAGPWRGVVGPAFRHRLGRALAGP